VGVGGRRRKWHGEESGAILDKRATLRHLIGAFPVIAPLKSPIENQKSA